MNTPDLLPTLLSLANLPVPETIEGENMAGAIENQEAFLDKAALFMSVSHFAGKGKEYRGIYTDRHTYVKSLGGPWLLYDHQNDPLEMDNLAGKPGFEILQEEMEKMLQRELEKVEDPFMPRQYYIDKWGYRLGEGGYIPYYFVEDLSSQDSLNILFQGPELNKKYR